MVLATVDDGRPVTRTVLCKSIESDGITFYSNYDSAKGADLSGVRALCDVIDAARGAAAGGDGGVVRLHRTRPAPVGPGRTAHSHRGSAGPQQQIPSCHHRRTYRVRNGGPSRCHRPGSSTYRPFPGSTRQGHLRVCGARLSAGHRCSSRRQVAKRSIRSLTWLMSTAAWSDDG
jgi:hypothetical protein